MYRSRMFACCLFLLTAAAGCKAQNSPDSPRMDRRIEVLVRSQFQVPPDYTISMGARAKSDVTNYDSLPITFTAPGQPDKATTVVFLISHDGNTLARLEKFDLSKDPRDMIATTARPVRGTDTAKVTIVNFDDLQCPYCAQMHRELFPETLAHYNGLLKVVYKDDPLIELHPWAMHAAVDANCLAAQSPAAYWSFVDYVHSHGQEVSGPDEDFAKSAATLDRLAMEEAGRQKLDMAKLTPCVTKQEAEASVRGSMKEAADLGIDGTPTLFVNGERLPGAVPIASLWKAIDRALIAAGVQPPVESAAGPPSVQSPAASGGNTAPPPKTN